MAASIEQTIQKLRAAVRGKQTIKVAVNRTRLNRIARKQPTAVAYALLQTFLDTLDGSDPERYIQTTISRSSLSIDSETYTEHLRAASAGKKSSYLQQFEKDIAEGKEPDFNTIASLVTYFITLEELVFAELLEEEDDL